MAKGTQRQLRERVLEELEEVDPTWAAQLRELRTTEPQAFRKAMIRVDVALSARLGRPTSLSMRPKRFGGDEDPVLVRRVQELRRHQRQAERQIVLPPSQWVAENVSEEPPEDPDEEGPFARKARERLAEGPQKSQGSAPPPDEPDWGTRSGTFRQDRTPLAEDRDRPPAEGGRIRGRTPKDESGPIIAEGGRIRGRAPKDESGPIVAEGGRIRGRAPKDESGPIVAEGGRPGRRAPLDRPDLSAVEGDAAGPDLSVLDGTVAQVRGRLDTGEHDAHLDALEAAERAGKARKGVLKALAARR